MTKYVENIEFIAEKHYKWLHFHKVTHFIKPENPTGFTRVLYPLFGFYTYQPKPERAQPGQTRNPKKHNPTHPY